MSDGAQERGYGLRQMTWAALLSAAESFLAKSSLRLWLCWCFCFRIVDGLDFWGVAAFFCGTVIGLDFGHAILRGGEGRGRKRWRRNYGLGNVLGDGEWCKC